MTLQNQVQELASLLTQIQADTKFLSCGHPILAIQHPDDIAAFDTETGLGESCWEGWALADGKIQKDRNNVNYEVPNLLDKFIVGAGDTYNVNDIGGTTEETLSIAQMPSHDHTLNDAGHSHTVTDPGHTHGIEQDPHNHAASGGSHTHAVSLSTSENGNHEHNAGSGIAITDDGSAVVVREENNAGSSTSSAGLHTHTVSGNTDAATGTVTVDNASISISNQEASTGLSVDIASTGISMNEKGGGEAHNNLPPYYALIYVVKL